MGPRRERQSDPAAAASLVILALAVAALTLYALVETGALARWAAALAARQWAREEEAAEPGALPRAVPGALPSRTVPAAPAPVLPRVDTVRSDTLDAEARPGRRPGVRRFGVQAFEGRILERLDRSRPDPRALTGIARVRVTDLAIEEPDGPRFAEAARAEFGIDLGALQTGDVLLSDVVLVKPDAVLRRGPGQDWNYQRAWRTIVGARGADADGGPSGGGTLELTDVRISGGRLVVESPGTSVAILGLDADIARATLSDPSAPAPEVLARSASGDVVLPGIDRRFAVATADAEARLDDDGTTFTAATATVDGARLTAVRGRYDTTTGLELALRAEAVPLADLRWFMDQLPDAGTASFTLDITPAGGGRSRVAITELAAAAGGSNVRGAITVVVGGAAPAALESVDLALDPLDLALLEPATGSLPVTGTVRGTLTGSAGALRFDAVAALTAAGATTGFDAALEGTAAYDAAGFRLTSLVAELDHVPLAALSPLIPGVSLTGTVTGTVALRGAPGAVPLDVDVRLALDVGTLLLRGALDLRGPVPAYDLTGQTIDLSLAALFGQRVPPAQLTADFTLAGSGTTAASATLRLALAGRFTGWQTDPGDAVDVILEIDNGTLRLDRAFLALATLDLEVSGTWRFAVPAAGELRYALRVADLAPFAPYLPLAADSVAAGEVWSEGTLSGPADGVRIAGAAALSGVRLDGWRIASARGTYAVTLGVSPAPAVLDVVARGVAVPGLAVYDTAVVAYRQEPPTFSLTVTAERSGGGVLALAADGRIADAGRREAVIRRFVADIGPDRWSLARPSTVAWGGEPGLDVSGLLLVEEGGPGRLSVDGRAPRVGSAGIRVIATAVPIGPVLAAARVDTAATGRIWLDAQVEGRLEAPVIGAEFRLRGATVQGVVVGQLEGELRYADQRLEIRAESLLEPARALDVSASLPVDLVLGFPPRWDLLDEGPVRATLVADSVALAAFEPWLRDVRDLEGAFSGRATVSGTVEEPRLEGSFALRRGAVTIIPFNERYREISADVRLEGSRVIVEEARAQSDGWAVARGTITFPALTEPVFDVALEFDGFRAFSARGRDAAAVTGSVALAGPLAGPTVSGRVVLDDGSVPVNAFTSRDGEELLLYDEGELLALPVGDDGAPVRAPLLASITFDEFTIVAGDGLWFATDGTRVQLAGEVVIVGAGEDLRVFGTLEGERGTFTLEAGPVVRRFDIERAEVRFLGETPPDPMLNVTAVRTVPLGSQREIAIVARITGTASSPVVAFTTPEGAAIPESELLSFLVFGRPSFALGEAAFLGQGVLGEFFLTGLTELTAIELEQELAADLGFDFFEIRPGFGAFGGLGLPTVILGREVAEDVFLTVEAGLGRLAGVETTAALAVRLQWRIDDQWQLELALEPATRARLLRGGTVVLPLAPPEQQVIIIIRRRWTY